MNKKYRLISNELNIMVTVIKQISAFLSKNASWVVIAAAIVALFFPDIFAWVQRNGHSSVILGLIMLTMGCTLSAEDFKILISRPLDILIGSIAQFTLMPLLAWSLTKIFGLNPYMAAGIILVGCCPGGVSSNIMSFLCKGDVAFSVGMTTVSTILSPILTPALVYLLAGTSIDVDAIGMFKNILVVTLIPVTVGCLFNVFLGKKSYFQDLQKMMPGLSVICLALIVGGVIFQVHPQLMANGLSLVLLTLAVVFFHNGLGYVFGYLVGTLFHFSTAKKRTISIDVGMQNAGMATVLANNFFATPAAIAANPMAALSVIPCAISCAYHSISGTILAGIFVRFDKKSKSNK